MPELSFLIRFCWILWGLMAAAGGIGIMLLCLQRGAGPEAGQRLGRWLAALLLAWIVLSGLGLQWLARCESLLGLSVAALLLLFLPLAGLGRPLRAALARRSLARSAARDGTFDDPRAAAFCAAIRADDAQQVARLLATATPPAALDRAGQDLVAIALLELVRGDRAPEILRLLLEAGADARDSRSASKLPLTHELILSHRSVRSAPAALKLLLAHGAPASAQALELAKQAPELMEVLLDAGGDVDVLDANGDSLVSACVACGAFESALLLIERGARLDRVAPAGTSLDGYLKSIGESTFEAPPAGWQRVLDALAVRRAWPGGGASEAGG